MLFKAAATAETKRQDWLCMSPTDRTRDLWVRFVRIQSENFFPQPQAKFVIWSVHFKENCCTRAFDQTQRRQLKRGSLLNIWGRKAPSTERDSTRQSRMKEKEQRKLRFLWVLLMSIHLRFHAQDV